MKKRIALIDTTSMYIRCSYLVHKNNVNNFQKDSLIDYTDSFDYYFNKLLKDVEADYYLAFDDMRPTFRHVMFPEVFKSDRKKQYYIFLNDIQHHAHEKLGVIGFKGLESDDLVSIASKLFDDVVVCHIDSDLNMITGNHYNYADATNYPITNKKAQEVLSKILLAGSHNGHKGLKGCGKVGTNTYISQPNYKGVLFAYVHGISKAEFKTSTNIKGLGHIIGTKKYAENYIMSKLCSTIAESNILLEETGFELISEDFFNDNLRKVDEEGN